MKASSMPSAANFFCIVLKKAVISFWSISSVLSITAAIPDSLNLCSVSSCRRKEAHLKSLLCCSVGISSASSTLSSLCSFFIPLLHLDSFRFARFCASDTCDIWNLTSFWWWSHSYPLHKILRSVDHVCDIWLHEKHNYQRTLEPNGHTGPRWYGLFSMLEQGFSWNFNCECLTVC